MYRTLKFQSSWPNTWVFDAQENPIAPGARELAEAIVVGLRRQLQEVTEISQHSFYGWRFDSVFESASFLHVLNPIEEVYLTISYKGYWKDWLLARRPRARFNRYCSLLTGVLKSTVNVLDVHPVLKMEKKLKHHTEPTAGGSGCQPQH